MSNSVRWSPEDLARHNAKQDAFRLGVKKIIEDRDTSKPSKYKSKRCVIDNLEFASLKEGRRYVELKNMQQAGLIQDLCLQVPLVCIVGGITVCEYRVDFRYLKDGQRVFEDAKGMRTDVYKLKRKLVLACFAIEILET